MLLSYGFRESPYGVRCCLLDVECSQIDNAHEYIIHDDAPSVDVGYPWAVKVNDTTVLVCFYLSDESGCRHIAGSLLKIEK